MVLTRRFPWVSTVLMVRVRRSCHFSGNSGYRSDQKVPANLPGYGSEREAFLLIIRLPCRYLTWERVVVQISIFP